MRLFLPGLVALVIGIALTSVKPPPVEARPAPPDRMPIPGHCLRDGKRQNIWLLPGWLAIFPLVSDTPGQRFSLDDIRRALPKAQVRVVDEGLVLVRDDAWQSARELNQAADRLLSRRGIHAFATFSLSAADLTPAWILTGRVVVRFRPGHDRSGDTRWARRSGLMQPQAGPGGTWIYKSGVGVRTLKVANALADSPDVESASPDWLHPMQKKAHQGR